MQCIRTYRVFLGNGPHSRYYTYYVTKVRTCPGIPPSSPCEYLTAFLITFLTSKLLLENILQLLEFCARTGINRQTSIATSQLSKNPPLKSDGLTDDMKLVGPTSIQKNNQEKKWEFQLTIKVAHPICYFNII